MLNSLLSTVKDLSVALDDSEKRLEQSQAEAAALRARAADGISEYGIGAGAGVGLAVKLSQLDSQYSEEMERVSNPAAAVLGEKTSLT
jgi:hypothetical protein